MDEIHRLASEEIGRACDQQLRAEQLRAERLRAEKAGQDKKPEAPAPAPSPAPPVATRNGIDERYFSQALKNSPALRSRSYILHAASAVGIESLGELILGYMEKHKMCAPNATIDAIRFANGDIVKPDGAPTATAVLAAVIFEQTPRTFYEGHGETYCRPALQSPGLANAARAAARAA